MNQEIIKDKDGDEVPEFMQPEEEITENKFALSVNKEQVSVIRQRLADLPAAFEYYSTIKEFCLKQLNKNRILVWGENPYLGEAAINAFRGPMGIYEEDINIWLIKNDGSKIHISDQHAFQGETKKIFISGKIGSRVLGVTAEFEGGRNVEDLNKKTTKDDILFFIKAARANLTARAIRKLLNIDLISWEELEPYGIKKSDCRVVPLMGADKPPSEESEEVWKMLLELTGNNIILAEKKCEEMTAFTGKDGLVPGKKKPSQLSAKQLPCLKTKLEKEIAAHRKAQGNQNPPEPKPAESSTNGNSLKFKTPKEALAEITRLTKSNEKYIQKAQDLLDKYDLSGSGALGACDVKFLNQFINELNK